MIMELHLEKIKEMNLRVSASTQQTDTLSYVILDELICWYVFVF